MKDFCVPPALRLAGAVTFADCEFIEQGQIGRLRRDFELAQAEQLPVLITGSAGYRLYLDGQCIHCGPEWNCRQQLTADELTLDLSRGKHQLEVLLWNHGLKKSAYREMSVHAFFILQSLADSPAGKAIDTATADYEAQLLGNWQLTTYHMSCMAGPRLDVDFRQLEGDWYKAVKLDGEFFQQAKYTLKKRTLQPDFNAVYRNFTLRSADLNSCRNDKFYETIPLELADLAAELLRGGKVTVMPHQKIRLLFDLNDYICARTAFDAEQGCGSTVETLLTESLFEHSSDWVHCYRNPHKGNRDEINGKYVAGSGDRFTLDGRSRHCPVLDWDAGRYLVCYIGTADEPLILKNFTLTRTHSGIELKKPISFANKKFNDIADLCLNSLQNCMHTTYMDCPHYEQLMYIGDGRIEALVNYVLAPRDHLLQKKALDAFAFSQDERGFTQARHPSREPSLIPGFSLFFINMLHDLALWSSDRKYIAGMLPAARKVIQAFETCRTPVDDLLYCHDMWNFYDWSEKWQRGEPPAADEPGALLNLHAALALTDLAELEEYAGLPANAQRWRQYAEKLKTAVREHFYAPHRQLYACDLAKQNFSQHVQAMALLCGMGGKELYAKLFDPAEDLAQCTVYFSHYLFECAKLFNDAEQPLKMLDFWHQLKNNGFYTTPERPEPSRSDCHGWGSHPLYYFVTGLGGIRPKCCGGKEFIFAPPHQLAIGSFELDLQLEFGSIHVDCQDGKFSTRTTGEIVLHKMNNRPR